MKRISDTTFSAEWGNDLLHDLGFIKERLRYPFNKKTLPLSLVISTCLLILSRLALIYLLSRSHNHGAIPTPPILQYATVFLDVLIIASIFMTGYRYYRTLRFVNIPTPYFIGENMKLIEAFLLSQRLALYRHPDAPEVFQIISRPLGMNPDGQREVMIFIADDKRVLVNSHFVNKKYSIAPPSDNAGNMAKRLRKWIDGQQASTSAAITVQ